MALNGKKIHFIGIGGIGISALAKFLRAQGAEVSGSDITEGCVTKELKQIGIKVSIPHTKDAICKQDLVIHSAIIKPENIEVQEAHKQGIPVLSRKESLKMILGNKEVFAVAGAHDNSNFKRDSQRRKRTHWRRKQRVSLQYARPKKSSCHL